MNAEQINKKVLTEEFSQIVKPNFLFFKPWKKLHAEINKAQKKNVVSTYLLRSDVLPDEDDNSFYNTYAFSLGGEIAKESLDKVSNMVNQLELGNLRYIGIVANNVYPHINEEGEIHTLTALPSDENGVFIFTIAAIGNKRKELVDCPMVLTLQHEKALKIMPLGKELISKLS